MHWQLQFTGMYNCTNAVIIAQVLIVCNALAIAMFRTKKTSSMASSIPAFGFFSQETMYVLCIIHTWIIAHGQSSSNIYYEIIYVEILRGFLDKYK